MSNSVFQTDAVTDSILALLQERYGAAHPRAKIEVYRYNPAAIRIRIVDQDFKGKSIAQREDKIWPILETFPAEVVADITVCLLITPEEQKSSLMNAEFEHPEPSSL